MLRLLTITIGFLGFSVAAQASANYAHADCLLFDGADQTGAEWLAQLPATLVFTARMEAPWTTHTASVWVRQGFVLEAYPDIDFKGPRMDLSAHSQQAVAVDQGYAINLQESGLSPGIGSYRCRQAGAVKDLARGNVVWLEGSSYPWTSGGNHPDQQSLTMMTEGGQAIVTVHADHSYGTVRQDYQLNLTTSQIHAEFVSFDYAHATMDFNLPMASLRPDFELSLQELVSIVKTVAAGYSSYAGLFPPKPELLSLAAYLNRFAP